MLLEEREGLGAVALAHPRGVSEFDCEAIVGQELSRVKDLVLIGFRDDEPIGVLQQDRSELPSLAQRLETDPVAREQLLARILRKVFGIHASLRGRLLRQSFANVFGEALGIGRVRGECREGFEIHDELVRRALGPQERLLLRRKRVERGVVLDDREVLGVVAQALVGVVLDPLGVPARLDQGGIGPRAGSDEKLSLKTLKSDRLPLGTDRGQAPRPSSFAAPAPSPGSRGIPRGR